VELVTYLNQNHTPGTVKRYQREIQHFFLSLENHKTASYTDIMDYLGKLRKAQSNVRPALHAIQRYYSWLNVTGQRNDNPAKSIRLRDQSGREIQLQDLFTPAELELLLQRKERYPQLRSRNQVIIGLLIYQGLTTGELVNLEVHDVNLEQGTIYSRGSGRINARTLSLKPGQIMNLYQYLKVDRLKLMRKPTGQLILNKPGNPETGEQISYLVSTFKHLYPERNLNPKTIRQSVIANLLKQGHDLRVVQTFAGHKYPSATEKYKQDDVEALKQEVLKYHPLG
jgi:integrase/recombinase XerD